MGKKNNKRHDELSDKIFKIGYALHEEGQEFGDDIITSIGDFMILISGIIHDENDVVLFGEICGMFSAKNILDAQLQVGAIEPKTEEELNDLLKKMKDHLENMDDEDDKDLDTDLDDELD